MSKVRIYIHYFFFFVNKVYDWFYKITSLLGGFLALSVDLLTPLSHFFFSCTFWDLPPMQGGFFPFFYCSLLKKDFLCSLPWNIFWLIPSPSSVLFSLLWQRWEHSQCEELKVGNAQEAEMKLVSSSCINRNQKKLGCFTQLCDILKACFIYSLLALLCPSPPFQVLM